MSARRVRLEAITQVSSSKHGLTEPVGFRRFESNHAGSALANQGYSPSTPTFRKCTPPKGPAGYSYRGLIFASVSEAAIGILLEKLIAGFTLRPGETFQVRTRSGHMIDFMVREVLVEFHHLRFYRERNHYGDFASAHEFQQYRRSLRQAKACAQWRERLIEQTRQRLHENYFARRRLLIDADPQLRAHELVVASTPRELYAQVLQRYSSQALDEEQFETLFKQQVRELLRTCAEVEKAARRCARKRQG